MVGDIKTCICGEPIRINQETRQVLPCNHNDKIITQWEPKIHKFLQTTFVLGMDKEDVAQELRIAILKAANRYNSSKGISFHTYLHTVMVNTIRTLISKAQKTKDFTEAYSIEGLETLDEDNFISTKVIKSLIDPTSDEYVNEMELEDILDKAKLSEKEFLFIELRKDGLTMEQISEEIEDSAYKTRISIQRKIRNTLRVNA